jgi:O-Antigen ligase
VTAVAKIRRYQNGKSVGRPLYFAIAALPFGLFLSIPVLRTASKTVPLTLSEITLVVLVFSYWRQSGRSGRPLTRRVAGAGVILMFAGWSLASLLMGAGRFNLSAGNTAVSGLYLARWVAYAFFYFAAYEAAASRQDARRMVRWLLNGGVAFAAFGLLQAVLLPGNFALWLHPGARPYIDYDPQAHRLVSSFMEPNIAAGFILIMALLALSFYVHGFKRWLWPFVLFVVALLATLSRGGVFGFVVGALFLFKTGRTRRGRMLKAGLLVAAASLALYPLLSAGIRRSERFNLAGGDSLPNRILFWRNDLSLVANNPLTGIGFNTLPYVSAHYDGELGGGAGGASAFGLAGDLLMILILTGAVGLLIYLRMLKEMLLPLLRLGDAGRDPWDRAFGRGAWAASIGAVASSCFATIIVFPQVMAALWVLWAVGRRLYGDAVMRRRGLTEVAGRPGVISGQNARAGQSVEGAA